ncbi:thiamine/thiamine pyrophosphate ABC transporter permease ThiP [Planktotalea arctica]|uniref:thiamine/thiamine pyrophosphate ABC transporter permease ThiP n=1 Tax=Planktotalea arctica TaxID=1481893 RepID=UPI000A1729C2|nr:thiamine/thiamine pyrophosphate ABC transporter permease ThiP [Planktotalea arctica]
MAYRAQQIAPPIPSGFGLGAATLVAALILGTLGVVASRAPEAGQLGPSDWAAVRFTVSQAVLSAFLSVLFAIPVARALSRRRFRGRGLLITLLGAPFLLPVIVAVMGLLAVFGRSGWVSQALELFGLPPIPIYGFHGVVIAHVFFNLPLATRVILQGWAGIPAERFRLAAQLGFSARNVARHLEWPMLKRAVPGAFAIVFAICLSSFAVALTMGGGPRATTVELAIYQAFRFDFDLGKAALLASMQLALAGSAALLALWMSQGQGGFGKGLDRSVERWDEGSRIVDFIAIFLAVLFLLVPMLAVGSRGLAALPDLPMTVWASAWMSIKVALLSAGLAFALSLPIALTAVRFAWIESVGLLTIAASPLVIGTGLFILVFPFASPQDWAFVVTACVNAVMALPFALRVLIPAVQDVCEGYGRLSLSLGLSRWAMLRLVILPRIRAPLGFATGLAAALSMGDLGVVALFAGTGEATLPLQIYRLMGAYRMDAAAGAALLLALLSFGAFWMCDAWGRRNA